MRTKNTSTCAPQSMVITATDVKHSIHIIAVMAALGMKVARRLRRADCLLCQGASKRTISYDRGGRLWHCHRCHSGGDIFNLIMLVQRCDFRKAFTYAAEIAGIDLGYCEHAELRRQLEKQKREREAAEAERAERESRDRERRLEARRWLHLLEQELRPKYVARLSELCGGWARESFPGEIEGCWEVLSNVEDLIRYAATRYRKLAGLPDGD